MIVMIIFAKKSRQRTSVQRSESIAQVLRFAQLLGVGTSTFTDSLGQIRNSRMLNPSLQRTNEC